jgi:hypothetical protein
MPARKGSPVPHHPTTNTRGCAAAVAVRVERESSRRPVLEEPRDSRLGLVNRVKKLMMANTVIVTALRARGVDV